MEHSYYIPIISDYGFKATFGNEANDLFLRKALQALIKSEIPIQKIYFDKNAFEALTFDSRSGIFDLSCTDEKGNQFIVEMQLGNAPNFLQRMKFYALHKFNVMIEKGKFNYSNLPKLFIIAILEKSVLLGKQFHTVINLRTEKGELIDSQMTFITVELFKFDKKVAEIKTDLEKLIYTMKAVHTTNEPTQYPKFWNEEWLQKALQELDTRRMTSEERAYFARVTAANAEAVNAERQRTDEAVDLKEKTVKLEAVKNLLKLNVLTIEQIATSLNVNVDFVHSVQQELF